MKQLEERAFSVIWICLNNLVKCRSPRCDCRFRKLSNPKTTFDDAVESPAKENVLRDWVNEVCPIYGVLDTADTLHYYMDMQQGSSRDKRGSAMCSKVRP